jgi:hypothetical protein
MSAPQSNLDAEREIDLARWRTALVARWWLLAAGLIAGAVIGVLFSFGGSGSIYKASSLISLGQPVSPGGVVLQGFGQNPRAVSQITSSAAAQDAAARIAGMHPGALRGNVSIATVGTATGTVRAAPLISLTVQGKVASKIAKAANALAAIVVDKTTAPYVGTKIATYVQVLATTNSQLASIANRLAGLNQALKVSHLDALNELVLVSQIDNAEQRQGNLNDQKATTQQQLAFSRNVESAKVITKAVSEKSTARSRSTSLIIGALIGLLLGAIVAVVADSRSKRPVAAV